MIKSNACVEKILKNSPLKQRAGAIRKKRLKREDRGASTKVGSPRGASQWTRFFAGEIRRTEILIERSEKKSKRGKNPRNRRSQLRGRKDRKGNDLRPRAPKLPRK